MDFFQTLTNFYQGHENLAIALLSLVGGALLTKFVPTLYNVIIKILNGLRRQLGARFVYRNIQDKYLNWVVLENQDLNLTGIIGSGQKPKLEQIFISLNILDRSEDNNKEIENAVKTEETIIISSPHQIWVNPWTILQKWIRAFYNKEPEQSRKNILTAFYPRSFWRLRLILERDRARNTLIGFALGIIFLILPPIALFTASNANSILVGIATSLLTFSFGISVSFLIDDFIRKVSSNEGLIDWIMTIILIILPIVSIFYIVITKVIDAGQSPLALIIGSIIGLILGVILSRSINQGKTPNFNRNKELRVEEVGKLLSSYENVAILGEPGAGKSTYIQFIALTFAQEKAGERKFRIRGIAKKCFGISYWYLSILIPLRKISRFMANEADKHSDKNLCFEAF